jgi:hypothetical protein
VYVGTGVAVSVGKGVSVGSGVDVSVGRGVFVTVGGGRVKVGGGVSSCGGRADSGAVGSVQAVILRDNVITAAKRKFEFIPLLYFREKWLI